jgi:hypothetical protein
LRGERHDTRKPFFAQRAKKAQNEFCSARFDKSF